MANDVISGWKVCRSINSNVFTWRGHSSIQYPAVITRSPVRRQRQYQPDPLFIIAQSRYGRSGNIGCVMKSEQVNHKSCGT